MKAAEYAYFDPGFIAFAHRGGATYPPNLHRENMLIINAQTGKEMK